RRLLHHRPHSGDRLVRRASDGCGRLGPLPQGLFRLRLPGGVDMTPSASPKTETAQPGFARNIVIAMVVIGVPAFAAFLVLSGFADDLREPDASGEHAQSTNAIGFAGLVALLKAEGRPVHLHRGQLSELSGQQTLLVLTPPPGRNVGDDAPFGPT